MQRCCTLTAETQECGRVALCASCYRDMIEDPDAPELEPVSLGVVCGYCHNCGAGWCECRGMIRCDYCPRRNSPVILMTCLVLYRIVGPPAPITTPRPPSLERP